MTDDNLPRLAQLTADDLDGMSDADIVAAHRAGRLNALLGAPAPVDIDALTAGADEEEHLVTREELKTLDPTEIVRLHSTGKLDHLLRPNQGA